MSQIFDALQRSEAERGKPSGAARTNPLEVLERAERHAAAQWRRDHPTGKPASPKHSVVAMPSSRGPAILEADDAELSTPENSLGKESQPGVLSDFKVLDIPLVAENRLVALADPDCAAAEAFRLLGVRLRHIRRERALRRLLITSTVPQEGKSMIAANLACTLAAGGQQSVLLLEGDVRRPALTELFRAQTLPGLCEWIDGKSNIMSTIFRIGATGPWFLHAGAMPDNPLAMIQSPKLTELIDQLAGWFDWIIIDSPPVLPLADTSVWSRIADGILLVARNGITEKRHLQRGIQAIDAKKLIGAVVNSATSTSDGSYYYYGRRPGSSSTEASGNS